MFKSLSIIGLLATLLLSGCATHNVQLVTDPTKIIEKNGFSLLPPEGNNWAILPSDPYMAIFGKGFMGSNEIRSTIGVVVSAGRFKDRHFDLKSQEGLREATEYIVKESDPNRFKIITSTFSPIYQKQATDCINFEYSAEEHNNPRFNGKILITDYSGSFCRHPNSQEYSVTAVFSERRLLGSDSVMDEQLRKEMRHCLESVRFTPVK